jgi:hypothetical protein
VRVLLLAIAIVVAIPARARAESNVIALLPLAADRKMQLYGQPVASEVAKALEQKGFSIVVVTSTAPVPSKARLVIDGRIVDGDGDTVKLEARVRDPKIGKVVAELSASAPSLTRIDEATQELAGQLATVLTEALKPPKEQKVDEPVTTEPAEVVVDKRPVAVLSMFSAVAIGKDDPVLEPLLHAGADRLAGLVGHRGADKADHAALKIHVELLSMRYEMGGVITARARARVRVLRSDDTVVFDRVVRTDTLVGGRGDRRDAVARAAVDQIVDIAMPRVRERLEKKKK